MSGHPGFNRRQKLLLAAMDVLLLVELVLAVRLGSRADDFSEAFLKAYVPIGLATFIAFTWMVRRNRTREDETAGQAGP